MQDQNPFHMKGSQEKSTRERERERERENKQMTNPRTSPTIYLSIIAIKLSE